ncbi:AEC family transporter [Spartinivicinus poritis]|uniref:AEC family transporter n=1 Tax=Spartinivicinus poritis TaxID=2994640 RepID=A0ABT5UDU5_9GAMM|nr:AEC family transporter [Spartinivicinus sp. A2-2]MDE1464538.1 AEC family transporter [Spartinivicinus sp. A2-2]
MITIIEALVPICFAIASGYIIKQLANIQTNVWSGIEKITYYVLAPAILIDTITRHSLAELPWPTIVMVTNTTIFACCLVLAFWLLFDKSLSKPTFTSVFQGGIRFNTFIALAITNALFGDEGLVIGALVAVTMIVLINILCVTTFCLLIKTENQASPSLINQLIKNPLIIACLIGLLFNAFNIHPPKAIADSISLLGRAAFPIGLMAVGAGLELRRLFSDWKPSLLASFVQFGFKPIVALFIISYFSLTPITATVIIIFFSVPTAPSSYILSRQLGGDHQSMASIITAQTMLSFITMPISLWIANQFFIFNSNL